MRINKPYAFCNKPACLGFCHRGTGSSGAAACRVSGGNNATPVRALSGF